MSCPSETITLANSFFTKSDGNYSIKNYTTTKDASGNNNTSCLPTTGTGNDAVSSFPPSSIDASGNIRPTPLSTRINEWLDTYNAREPATLTPTNNDPVTTFAAQSAKIRSAIKAEYCYYYNRYEFMLNLYLTNEASETAADNANALKQKDCTMYLNSVLNQILQMYQGLINSRNSKIAEYYTNTGMNINSLNEDVNRSRESLQSQSTILKNQNLKSDIQSAMVEYSIEKNQSSRNLLVIYGFMNLVAAGLIVYLYRSTRI